MENRMINATYDFTEQDQINLEWLKRKQAVSIRGELIVPSKQVKKYSVKDNLFILSIATAVISFLMVLAVIWLG